MAGLGTGSRSRRSVLTTIAGAVAGAATASLAAAQRVLAAGSDGATVVVGGGYLDVRSETTFQNVTTDSTVLAVLSSGANPSLDVVGNVGDAVHGFGTIATGVKGTTGSPAGFGVVGVGPYVAIKGTSIATGTSNGSGVGVFGSSAADDGAGVEGMGPSTGVHGVSAGIGVYGEGTGGGIGLLGNSDSGRAVVGVASASSGRTIGVMGEAFSTAGTGVRGWAAGGATGVYGFSGDTFPSGDPPANTGVYGRSATGRGGVFAGKAAQVRLVPSSAGSHPASGQLGDLFLDANKRLWLCKGGKSWHQLG